MGGVGIDNITNDQCNYLFVAAKWWADSSTRGVQAIFLSDDWTGSAVPCVAAAEAESKNKIYHVETKNLKSYCKVQIVEEA